MRIDIAAVGRLKQGPERELVSRYGDRLTASGRAIGLSGPHVTEIAESPARSAPERMAQEAQAILAALPAEAILVALDERGATMASDAFAARIGRWRDEGRRSLAFVVGGPDGLSPVVRDRAAELLSFGRMTMPHQLVRVLLLEQLYRAATILSGHPYHRV
jgi:23S rRNA (pseudouridine1915-N3)-methyltransferase